MENRGTGRSLFLADPASGPAEPVEAPATPHAPPVELGRGRRRWLQVLVVLAVVAGGVVANRSNARPSEEQAALEQDRAGEGPLLGPTSLPQSLRTVARLGPLLPEPTATTLVLAAGTQVAVLDVDSGTLRNVHLADLRVEAGFPWGSPVVAVGDAFVVRSRPPLAKVIPRTDGQPVADLDAGSGGGLYPSTTDGAFWVEELRGEGRLEEVDRADVVRRTVALPDGGESVVWDGAGFVQTVDGVARAYPADGGAPTDLVEGLAVAADAATVAALRCPGGDWSACDLWLTDRVSGASRPVSRPADVSSFRAGFGADLVPELSPDGRWLVLQATSAVRPADAESDGAGPGAGAAVVDVAAGSVVAVDAGSGEGVPAATFSPDSRWLFLGSSVGTVSAELDAVRLVDRARFDLDVVLSARASFGLVLEAFPSTAADLGAEGG